MSRVLVLGGSGHLGSAVVRALADHDVVDTRHRRDGPGIPVDLTVPGAVDALFDRLGDWVPDHLVHCAGLPASGNVLATTEAEAEAAWRLYAGATLASVRRMLGAPTAAVRNVVLFSALAPGQSWAVPPAFAAAQGALPALAMALGHELGPRGFRVNVVALGLLDGGQAVSPEARAAYLRFSALRRIGTAEEAAATARWLVTANTVLNGKVLAANGGI